MLNCSLLLDSANRFGLKEGGFKFPCDAKKDGFLVSLLRVRSFLSPTLTLSPTRL